jgi:hypothetical protein
MAHHALGQAEEAKRWFEQANEWTKKELASTENPTPWNRKLTLELLRTEANELIANDAPPERDHARNPN